MSNGAEFSSSLSHVGIRVRDLDRSTRFYCEGFGFERLHDVAMGNEAAGLLGAREFSGRMRILQAPQKGPLIELITQDLPKPNWRRTQEDNYGLYHLSIRVSDLDEGLQRIREYGGAVFPHRAGELEVPGVGRMKIAFGADPDGQIIELVSNG